MKLRWKIALGVVAVGAVAGAICLRPDDRAVRTLEETRQKLRKEGFRTELSDFNLFTSPEARVREAAITNAGFNRMTYTTREYAERQRLLQSGQPMTIVGTNTALVIWKTEPTPDRAYGITWNGSYWSSLREALDDFRTPLDRACDAALGGPISFDLNAVHGSRMLLRHLALIKSLSQTLGQRMMLELHDGHDANAWTNLLAATRLITAWQPEPVEVSHMVHMSAAAIAFNTTWQALQSHNWKDAQLAELQREWAGADFFKHLPETAAYTGVSAAEDCRQEREQPVIGPGLTFQQILRSPKSAWYAYRDYRQRLHYRNHGSYENEAAYLTHYCDLQRQLEQAVKCTSWMQMCDFPVVTNRAPFLAKYPSRVQSMMNMRFMNLSMQGGGQGLVGRAAEAETRRRIILTALALERHRLKYGKYPQGLTDLTTDFLPQPLTDFMNGQPLHYSAPDDTHFVLYSVGLDGADDGGRSPERRSRLRGMPMGDADYSLWGVLGGRESDIVWPRPAATADVASFEQEKIAVLKRQTSDAEESQATEQWRHSAHRQAQVEKILSKKPDTKSATSRFRRPRYAKKNADEPQLNEVLANSATLGTNKPTIEELLTLKQVITGKEPEQVTFEVPIAYDVLTNLGAVELIVDPIADEEADEGAQAVLCECERAANGNCRLVWNTIYEAPGKHALLLGLSLEDPASDDEIIGPQMAFTVTNLCEFSLTSATFNPLFGGTFRVKLPESNATYSAEIKLPEGERVKTIKGSTSNGIITFFWDLTDDQGNRRTNNAYETLFDITLKDSGRTQKLRGP